jgi:hypothetical protein
MSIQIKNEKKDKYTKINVGNPNSKEITLHDISGVEHFRNWVRDALDYDESSDKLSNDNLIEILKAIKVMILAYLKDYKLLDDKRRSWMDNIKDLETSLDNKNKK